jgi:hypothetical protein
MQTGTLTATAARLLDACVGSPTGQLHVLETISVRGYTFLGAIFLAHAAPGDLARLVPMPISGGRQTQHTPHPVLLCASQGHRRRPPVVLVRVRLPIGWAQFGFHVSNLRRARARHVSYVTRKTFGTTLSERPGPISSKSWCRAKISGPTFLGD